MRLSLIGPSGAGKTVFITTMLQELRQNARTLKFSLSAMNKETSDYQSINTKILYDSYAKKIIGGTTTGQFKALLWLSLIHIWQVCLYNGRTSKSSWCTETTD